MGARMALDMRRGKQESWESRAPLEPLRTSSNPDELCPVIEGDPSCRSVARRTFGPLLRTGLRYVQGVRLTVSRHVSQGQDPLHLTLREMQVSQARFGGMACWHEIGSPNAEVLEVEGLLDYTRQVCRLVRSIQPHVSSQYSQSTSINETTHVELYFQSPQPFPQPNVIQISGRTNSVLTAALYLVRNQARLVKSLKKLRSDCK
jgi:hypothetical protein